jgi:hypothetical protein
MQTAVAISARPSSAEAGQELVNRLRQTKVNPAAMVVFAAPSYDHESLLAILGEAYPESLMIGASSAGEFMNQTKGEGLVCVMALSGDDASFGIAAAHDVKNQPAAAARQMVSGFKGLASEDWTHRSALVLTDALAGHADLLVDELTLATAGQYQFFGGGAGDNAQFKRTPVFFGRQVLDGAAVALEILSDKPLGIGVRHGWQPASRSYRVTEVEGMRLVSLDGLPAIEAFDEHAQKTGQKLDHAAPIPFFLHNILGIDTGNGHRLRVPLGVGDDGSVLCAAEIPTGALIQIMQSSEISALEAADGAAKAALSALGGAKPKAGLFFDCVATRLRMGNSFDHEIATVRDRLQGADLMGCNTHGQIARAPGQFEGFHNCTAVVCLFPE